MRFLWSFIVVFSLTIYSVPYVIKDQSLIWLKQQGIEQPKLNDVSISWHTGTVEIKGLVAEKAGLTPLKIDSLKVSIDLLALFQNRLLINQLELIGFTASYEQRDNTRYFGAINLNRLQSSNEPNTSTPKTPSKFQFGFKALALADISLVLNTPQFQHQLQLTNANFENLYQWAPNQLSQVAVKGHFNDAPIAISSASSPLSDNRKTQLNLALKSFPLTSITRPFVENLSATVDADINIDFKAQGPTFIIEHSGQFKLEAFKWHTDQQKIALQNLHWQGAGELSINLDGQSQIEGEGEIALQNFELATNTGPSLKVEALNWHGPMAATFNKQVISKFSIAEQLRISNLHLKSPVALSIANIVVKPGKEHLQVDFSESAINSIRSSNTTQINKLLFSQKDTKVQLASLSTHRSAPLSLHFTKGQLNTITDASQVNLREISLKQGNTSLNANSLSFNGPLSIKNINQSPLISSQFNSKTTTLRVKQDNLAVSAENIELAATLEQLDLAKASVKQATLNVSNIDVSDLSQSLSLFSAAKLDLNDASYSPTLAAASSFKAQQLKLVKASETAVLSYIKNLAIDNIKLKNNSQLEVSRVSLNDSSHQLQITENGQIALLDQLLKSVTGKASSAAKSEPNSTPNNDKFLFDIKRIDISGNNQIDFQDKSVEPWFESNINLNKVTLKALSNSFEQPSPFALNAVINDETKLQLQGQYALFSEHKTGQWQLNLDNLSLPIISPYAGSASGYFLDSGKLSLNSKGAIDKGVIKGLSKIKLQQLAVRSAESDATQKTNQSLSMPLDLAIALLEDSDGNIDLSVPISGSVDDPNFGYSSVVEIIAKKGMKQAAFSLLTKSLQPYGALLTVATTVLEANQSGSFINLAPVSFSPGKSQINPDMQGYVAKLALMMQERQKLKLKLCGRAVMSDKLLINAASVASNSVKKKPLNEQELGAEVDNLLQSLATERGKVVKQALQKKGVSKERLFVCFAKVELKDEKLPPNVSLGL